MSTSRVVEFTSLDGLRLTGTLVESSETTAPPVVLVHGGGVTRDEAGFFTRLAEGIAQRGAASLRFDLRGHGDSAGRQEDLTLSGILNDIRAASATLMRTTDAPQINLLGTSFSGGICAYFAATYPDLVRRLVLSNPLLNYKKRFIDDKPYWHDDRLDADAAKDLLRDGYLAHSPTFKLGRPLLNEVFYLRPNEVLEQVQAPTLFVHGTRDTFIPVDSSRQAVDRIAGPSQLLEIEGAQHGFAVHDDPQYLDPQSQEWQAFVVREVAEWFCGAEGQITD